MSEAPALPTDPQPLPLPTVFGLFLFFSSNKLQRKLLPSVGSKLRLKRKYADHLTTSLKDEPILCLYHQCVGIMKWQVTPSYRGTKVEKVLFLIKLVTLVQTLNRDEYSWVTILKL